MELEHPVRFTILVGAALFTSYLVYRSPSRDNQAPPAPRLGFGYYVKHARLTGTGVDGNILYHVTTTAAEQALADGTITLRDVGVDYEPVAQVPWKLSADHGHIPPGRNIIQLYGDVVAETDASEVGPSGAAGKGTSSVPPLVIRTDYLELDPEAYIARTERMVTVDRSRDTLRAKGMIVYLKQDRLLFNSEVRGRFRP